MRTWTDDTGVTHTIRGKSIRVMQCFARVPRERRVDWIDDPPRVPTCLACIGTRDGRLPYGEPTKAP